MINDIDDILENLKDFKGNKIDADCALFLLGNKNVINEQDDA